MKFKYIMTLPGPVIFTPSISHAKVELKEEVPLSAGFVDFTVNELGNLSVKCYGESDSLGLASKPTDAEEFMVWGNILK
jgi:hypothetical protein